MANELQGKRVAFLATDGVEQIELTEPWAAVEQAGGTPELISIKPGTIQGVNGMEPGDTFNVDTTVDQVMAADYDGLVLSGRVANPDKLRTNVRAVEFVRFLFERAKPAAAICHGPWVLVEADVVRGRRLASFPSIQTDIRNAGGNWVDVEVHTDQGLVTSRAPDDLPAFCDKLVEEFAEGEHPAQAEKTRAAD